MRCQVIVKLSNIVLTPEQRKFRVGEWRVEYWGGEWRVEGGLNEHIVAVGVYYSDATNISEPELRFRSSVKEPIYDGSDDEAARANITRSVFGLEGGHKLVQSLGIVETKSDRCIAFPNFFHHCGTPVGLLDRSRSGVLRSLVFFLVDPSVRIASTADVPPQQPRWLEREMISSVPGLQCLPEVLVREVMAYVGGITPQQACTHRKALQTEHITIVRTLFDERMRGRESEGEWESE